MRQRILGVYVASSSSADLQWADRSSNETGFKIERMGGPAPGGLVYKEIATVGVGTTDYSDTGLEANTMYTYRVRAANGFGNSTYSNEASGTTLLGTVNLDSPNAPTNLVANGASSSIIDLQWADQSTNETGFKIERMGGPNGSVYKEVGTVGANITSYSNAGLNENTAYQYRVMAYNVIGNSAYTNIASAKTKALVSGATSLRLYIDSMKYFVNDVPNTMDAATMLKDNRTLLPIRYIVEPLGGDVKWDAVKQMVTVTLGSKTIILWVGNNMASVNGVTIPIDSKDAKVMPIIVWPGRTMVPMRFVTENLGCEVIWTPSAPKDITVTY